MRLILVREEALLEVEVAHPVMRAFGLKVVALDPHSTPDKGRRDNIQHRCSLDPIRIVKSETIGKTPASIVS